MNVCVCVHLCVCILTLLYGLYRAASISASHGLSAKEIADRTEQFGENDIAIPPASFRELYIQQITSPIFVFQVHALVCVCVVSWLCLCCGCGCDGEETADRTTTTQLNTTRLSPIHTCSLPTTMHSGVLYDSVYARRLLVL